MEKPFNLDFRFSVKWENPSILILDLAFILLEVKSGNFLVVFSKKSTIRARELVFFKKKSMIRTRELVFFKKNLSAAPAAGRFPKKNRSAEGAAGPPIFS